MNRDTLTLLVFDYGPPVLVILLLGSMLLAISRWARRRNSALKARHEADRHVDADDAFKRRDIREAFRLMFFGDLSRTQERIGRLLALAVILALMVILAGLIFLVIPVLFK